ncbi:MAG TPA: MFS transporter [Syntrophorhabdaceae bacterium]|nr:MFS transporter [Syntrophorhabdaceae bacterium]
MKTETASVAQVGQNAIQRATHYRWVILVLMFLFFLINQADRANIGVVLPFVRKEFALTNLQAGALASMFFLGYAVTQIPAGLFMGRIGARLMTSLSVFVFSVFTFLIGVSPGATAMKWFRFGLGVGEGPAGIGAGTLIKAWFPHKEQATATALYMNAAPIAFILAPPTCIAIMMQWGWRGVFYCFAIPGIIVAAIWYILVRNRPEESRFCSQGERDYIVQSAGGMRSKIGPQITSMGWLDKCIRVRRGMTALDTPGQVFQSWNVWADCFIFFFAAMCQWGMLIWIPSYLVNERHLSMVRMGLLAAVPNIGSFLGAFFGGWTSDKLLGGRRKPMIFLTAIGTIVMMYLLAHAPASQGILAFLLFFNGFATGSSMSIYISYPMGLTTRRTFPTALGLVSTAGSIGGFLSPMVAGYLLDTFKTFNVVFYFFALALGMTFLFALTMVEPLETLSAEKD